MSRDYCCVPQCSTRSALNPELSFHRFPMDQTRRNKWRCALRIGREVSSRMVVCSKHFQKNDYFFPNLPTKLHRLKKNVIPTRNLPVMSTDSPSEGDIKRKHIFIRAQKKNKVSMRFKKGKTQNLSVSLSAEASDISHLNSKQEISENVEPVILQKNYQRLSEMNRILDPVDKCSEINFNKESEQRIYETKLSNRNESIIQRKCSLSKGDSITTEQLHKHFKETIKNSEVLYTVKHSELSYDGNLVKDHFSYSVLLHELSKIEKPSEWWTISSTPSYVMCTKWDHAFNPVCRVAVCLDLTVKIFLGMKETVLPSIETEIMRKAEDLSQLLSRLEKVLQLRQEIEMTRIGSFKEESLET